MSGKVCGGNSSACMVAWPQEYKRVVVIHLKIHTRKSVEEFEKIFDVNCKTIFIPFSDGLIISKVWHSLIPNIFFVNKRATTTGFLYRTKI